MARSATVEPTVDLRGKTGPEIAQMVSEGTITQKIAEEFVAQRAVNKLRKAIES
jgi:hypothetical protein